MKFAMMATGGIGGFLAVRLIEAGRDVSVIARGPHLEAIRTNGLRLVTPSGESNVHPRLATADPAEIGPVDVVIFGVKGDSLAQAAAACAPLLGPETAVVPFLNGVEASSRLAAILPPANVAEGVAHISTTISEPGTIAQTGLHGRFTVAERDSAPSERIDRLKAALRNAGIDAPDTDDIERDIWLKFIFISGLSGVTAAGRCRVGQIFASPALVDLLHQTMRETAALGRARGVVLPDNAADAALEAARALPGDLRASTAVDIEAGRRLETNWINGAVVRLSAECGLDAPANRALLAILSPWIDGAPG